VWHGCPESVKAREEADKRKQKAYDKDKRPGLIKKEKKLRKSASSDRHLVRLANGSKMYECQSKVSEDCWGRSHNRFNCPACLEKLESMEDICLDVLGYPVVDLLNS